MGWFTKPRTAVETISRERPGERYAEVKIRYSAALAAYDAACREFRLHPWPPRVAMTVGNTTNIQTLKATPAEERILSKVRETKAMFMAVQKERSDLERELGLIH